MAECEQDNNARRLRSKRPINQGFYKTNYIYVSNKIPLKEQEKKCNKLFSEGVNEVFLYCTGRSIPKGINLALNVIQNSKGTLNFEAQTLSLNVFDNLHPMNDDDDFETQTRKNSTLKVRIFKVNDLNLIEN